MIKTSLKVFIAVVLVSLLLNFSSIALASAKNTSKVRTTIVEVINELQKAANSHDLKAVSDFYTSSYLSGDYMNKQQMLDLVKDTWEAYPNINYTSEIGDVRCSEDWATVETHDTSTAATAKPSEITGDIGSMHSHSNSIIYLRKIGKEWKIVSDYTLFEEANVMFGSAKTLDVKFSAPEQVRTGEMYSAKLSVDVPVGYFTVGSVTQEPIVFPPVKPKERFRSINQNTSSLERVFEANEYNSNEFVTATVGISELTEDNQARPTIKLKGIYITSKRVNVIPNNTFDRKTFIITHKENIDVDSDNSKDNSGIIRDTKSK